MIEFLVNRWLFLLLIIAFIFLLPRSIVLSQGDQYNNRLQLWHYFALKGDWTSASALEPKLDQIDLIYLKSQLEPATLKKQLNTLIGKFPKTSDDWLEITRINLILGKTKEAIDAITQAHQLDPIRDDISKIFYQITQK
ncbi:MAG: hypothetical protein NTY75_02745 [Candidatus Shapirobacteria bacterium]|nr:hypothetical protein [Candidatus Shapirobacteria bacterium]